MMLVAQGHEVRHGSNPAVAPVHDVMHVGEVGIGATGKAAALVAASDLDALRRARVAPGDPLLDAAPPVSYTHLDVYKRQGYLYVATLAAAAVSIIVLQHYRGWSLIALAAFPLAAVPVRLALGDGNGRQLLPMLATTARLQLAVGILLTAGLLLVRP